MDISLSALIQLYQFPTGRRLFASRRVAARAETAGFTELKQHCDAAIAQDKECQALEHRWASIASTPGKRQPSPADARPTDALVDRTLTAIRNHAEEQRAGAAPDDPIHAMVVGFLGQIFPAGLQKVTRLPYIEELEAVDGIVAKLKSKELAPVVKDLGLERLRDRLADLAVQYRTVLEKADPETLAFGKVRAARAEGQDMLLEAVAIILGKHHGKGAADVAARAELLAPILEQNEAIGALIRSRRSVTDVHEQTGAEEPEGTGAGGGAGAGNG